jgi:uncharacterized double-CXXCG motif protein
MPYIAKPDDAGWGKDNDYLILAVRARSLPGMVCGVHGVWATTGLNYPTVDIALIDSQIGRLPVNPISVDDYRALVAQLEPIIGPERLLNPGVNLGPLRGTARGLLGDFAWINSWTMLVRSSTYQELLSSRFPIQGAQASISFEDGPTEPLVELEAICKVTLAEPQHRELCTICGRPSFVKPKTMVLDAASYDNARPLQRIVEMPTYIVINDDLGEFIRMKGFSNITLTRIEIN